MSDADEDIQIIDFTKEKTKKLKKDKKDKVSKIGKILIWYLICFRRSSKSRRRGEARPNIDEESESISC